MTESAFAVLALLVLGWAVVSGRLARWNITGPLVFTVAGYLLGNPAWGPLAIDADVPSLHLLAELTLALVLFSDASKVDFSQLRRDLRVPERLLGIGLPLTVILGALAAAVLFGDFTWALAAFVGAALAPTDAALSEQVIDDERVPVRVRRALNVESGLNDGIVTPVVVFTLAVAAGQLGVPGGDPSGVAPLLELALGTVVGLAIGLGAARLVALAQGRRWMLPGGRRIATLAAALGSFLLAVTLDGNGFVAAFVAGLAFGAGLPKVSADSEPKEEIAELPELLGEVLALAVWFLFGAALVPVAVANFSPVLLLYAVLSLTVLRMAPVALGLLGTRLDGATVLFVGWFGPRGLASVVFALLALEELGDAPVVGTAVAAVTFTVLLSVVVHGVSAGPLGRRYALGHADPIPGAAAGTGPAP